MGFVSGGCKVRVRGAKLLRNHAVLNASNPDRSDERLAVTIIQGNRAKETVKANGRDTRHKVDNWSK